MVQLLIRGLLFIVVTEALISVGADIPSNVPPTGCTNYLDSPEMNDEFRNFILNIINGYRSQLAKGLLKSSNGTYFPSAKNMNKLTWDCRIEAAGRETNNNCQGLYNPEWQLTAWKQSYFWNESALGSPERAMELLFEKLFYGAVERVVNEDGMTWIEHPQLSYMTDYFESFACWYAPAKNCSNVYYPFNDPNATIGVVCGYSPPTKFAVGSDGQPRYPKTYTLGHPCSIDSDCTNPNGFTFCDAALGLCTKAPISTTTFTPIISCASGWFLYENACYKFVNGSTNRSQAQAEQWCKNQGKKGHLVSIHSKAENDFVKSLFSFGDNVLIGYNNQAWTDATPFNYNNFSTSSGNNACAALIAPDYQWKSVNCNDSYKQFICKQNI